MKESESRLFSTSDRDSKVKQAHPKGGSDASVKSGFLLAKILFHCDSQGGGKDKKIIA